MKRRLHFPLVAALCAMLAACAPLIANHDEQVEQLAVKTPSGALHLAFKEEGRGRPILLLHGLGTSGYTWREIMPELAKNHRVIALDLRGFGASDKPRDEHYAIADQAQAVQAFIEQEDLRDLTVIGHSFGGGVTLALALAQQQPQQPPRLRNIVLIDTIAYRQPLPVFFRLLRVPMVAEVGMALIPPEVQAAQALRVAYYNQDKITARAVAEYASPLYSSAARYALAKTVDLIVPDDIDEVSARYKTLKLPTQIIWCDKDRIVPLVLGRRLHEDIPSAELTVLSECGHLPHEEKPQDTAQAIEAFLAHHGG